MRRLAPATGPAIPGKGRSPMAIHSFTPDEELAAAGAAQKRDRVRRQLIDGWDSLWLEEKVETLRHQIVQTDETDADLRTRTRAARRKIHRLCFAMFVATWVVVAVKWIVFG